ncbi:DUF6069 family protein [Actinomycetospora sp. NBRC 106378]|uniref:DUF6069 family protein n=1 Tax=Actinomycetospora sp. NBRC 106378 TaxID=3032208 RepID=UPI0024A2A1F9|nr:DUF6069 family protein [Actinomycetospora sp. NBRC 106378]GLZ51317.1 hypothetical protein Acsp07_09340 [Actinomycetospora sp. NBRC 106378]
MSVLTAPAATTTRTSALVLGGLAATVGASIATSAIAAAGNAVGISLDISGAPIPVPGFASLTAIFSVIGLVLALVLSRTARSPRMAFVRTTVVLTALSLVPDVLADAATATKLLLMLTHLVAAAIVVPVIARRLAV